MRNSVSRGCGISRCDCTFCHHPGVIRGDALTSNAWEERSEFVPRPARFVSHRDAWSLLRDLLHPFCLDLRSIRTGGALYSCVRTLIDENLILTFDSRQYECIPPKRELTFHRLLCGAAWGRMYGDFIWQIVASIKSVSGSTLNCNPGKYALIGENKANCREMNFRRILENTFECSHLRFYFNYSTLRARTTKLADCISSILFIWLKKCIHI